jgi:hypothetical protein
MDLVVLFSKRRKQIIKSLIQVWKYFGIHLRNSNFVTLNYAVIRNGSVSKATDYGLNAHSDP